MQVGDDCDSHITSCWLAGWLATDRNGSRKQKEEEPLAPVERIREKDKEILSVRNGGRKERNKERAPL